MCRRVAHERCVSGSWRWRSERRVIRDPVEATRGATDGEGEAAMRPRFVPVRVVKDAKEPKRYQRSGWLVFDTKYPISYHLFVNTKYEAASICRTRNAN